MSRFSAVPKTIACLLSLAMVLTLALALMTVAPAQQHAQAVSIDRNRIKQVIYPTFGYPQISRSGDQFTVEFDPRDQDWSQPMPSLVEFTAYANTSVSDYPVNRQLRVDSFGVGYSTNWPEYAQSAQPDALIYLVSITVTDQVPYDLYDLTVNGRRPDGSWISDAQPHSLSVVEEFKDDLNLCQLTDIHVWGPEAWYPGSNSTHQRNYRHADYREQDGYGAEYYHQTIRQVNLQKPDVCVFTGDFDFSQKWLYQEDYADFDAYKNSPWSGDYYEPWFEMDWFYQETMKMDVPVFIAPGNHDGYARYNLWNTELEEDYMASWRNLFGPQYFSFDYGPDYHFTALNSMDWTPTQRNLHWLIPDVMLLPGKWQGQVQGGGDSFQPGWTQARENAIDLSKLTGQLAWARDDLADPAHAGAKMRIIALHCDPWKLGGSGSMFDNAEMFGIKLGGRGAGRLALIKLARVNNVALMVSGHDHSDSYGSIAWELGGGQVDFVNTTSVMFQDAPSVFNPMWDKMWVYPGYRMIHIDNGDVVNFYYKVANDQGGTPLQYSWPSYQGTNVGGETNFANLVNPAVQSAWSPAPGTSENVTCTIDNYLCGYEVAPGGEWSGDLRSAGIDFPMPYLSGGYYYEVTGGAFGDIYDYGAVTPTHRVYQVSTDVGHAPNETNPNAEAVSVNKSAAPDIQPPTCTSFLIDGGAASTTDADVVLTNNAVDPGGAGLLDMKVWNDGDSEGSALWQRYEATTEWTLRKGAGLRTVNIRFRDAAMPGNVSVTYSASIALVGLPPSITSVDPPSSYAGGPVTITGTGFGAPRTFHDNVLLNGAAVEIVSWTDTSIDCAIPVNAFSGSLTVATDAGSDTIPFQVLPWIDSVTPDFGFNDGVVEITDLAGSGFYASGAYPQVKLDNGTVDILATDVQVRSPHSVSCTFNIEGAPAGYYNVVLENVDGGSDTLYSGFAVDYPPPAIESITPDWGMNGGTVAISEIKGTHFRDGATVELRKGGVEIDATSVSVVSDQVITCSFDLNGAETGAWDVVVINPDTEYASLAGGFNVVNPTFYFAEGTCRPDFVPYLCIQNPGGTSAQVRITYMKGNGTTVTQEISVGANTRATVLPSSELGSGDDIAHDFSSVVQCTNGQRIVVERPMYFNYRGEWTDGSDVVGINAPSSTFYFAEGTCRPDFDPYLCIQNPGDAGAEVKITYLKGDSTEDIVEVFVGAHSRLTVNPRDELGTGDDDAHDFSAVVECINGQRIVAERPMYFNYQGEWNGGHDVMGATAPGTVFYFAEGYTGQDQFDEWLCLANPGTQPASVTITYMFADGTSQEQLLTVDSTDRDTVNVNEVVGPDREVSVKVASDLPIVAERPMYFNYQEMWTGGSCVIGAAAPGSVWQFAEGYTGPEFEDWLTLANPGDAAASVKVTYMPQGAAAFTRDHVVPAYSRYTIDVNADAGSDLQLSCQVVVTSGPGVIAERPMYFNYNGAWNGGHDAVGYQP